MLSQHDYSRFVVYREHKGQSNLVQRQTQVEEENIRGIEENAAKEQELPLLWPFEQRGECKDPM